jgi:hypothetical protein
VNVIAMSKPKITSVTRSTGSRILARFCSPVFGMRPTSLKSTRVVQASKVKAPHFQAVLFFDFTSL